MQHRTATARGVIVLVLSAGLASVASAGCKDEPKPPAPPATSAAAPVQPMKTYTWESVTFQYPANWRVEETSDGKGVSVVAPRADGGWIPSVHLVIASNPRGRDLDGLMDTLLDRLRRKQGFELKKKETLDHPNGFKYVRIDYINIDENSGANFPLRQLSAQALLPGKKRLEIQAATAKDDWEKYQPNFDQVIASVKLPK